jgi:hypothetical protein
MPGVFIYRFPDYFLAECQNKNAGEVCGHFHAWGHHSGNELDPTPNLHGILGIFSMKMEGVRKSVCSAHVVLQGDPGLVLFIPIENGIVISTLDGWK